MTSQSVVYCSIQEHTYTLRSKIAIKYLAT